MTCAVSAAVREGAKAVICASTGNTSASRRRLRRARRHPLRGARARRQDRDRQARAGADARRARDRAARQLRRGAAARARAGRPPSDLARQLGQPDSGWRGRRRPRSRSSRRSARSARSTRSASRSATPATSPPTGRASARLGVAPRMFGFQAAGAAPLVEGAPVANPETVASAIRIGNPARWEEAMDAMTSSHGRGESGHRRADPRRLPLPRRARGRLLRAGLGGERRRADGARRRRRGARRVRADRPRPEGPGDRARPGRRGRAVRAGAGGRRGSRASGRRHRSRRPMVRRRLVRVPASSANLGPGFDVLAAALALHLEVEVVETGQLRGRDRPADRARPPQPRRARVRAAAPAGRLHLPHLLGDPAVGRARVERGGDRRRR